MWWENLKWNLLSEGIGILVAVFFLDQILVWREKRKWREVKRSVIIYASRYSDLIIEKWGNWLTTLRTVSDDDITEYRESIKRDAYFSLAGTSKYPIKKELKELIEIQDLEGEKNIRDEMKKQIETLKQYLGNPIGSKLLQFAAKGNLQVLNTIEECLETFFDLTFHNCSAQTIKKNKSNLLRLKTELEPLVEKLNNLIDRYSTIIDHDFSLPLINVALATDDLNISSSDFTFEDRYVNFTLKEGLINSIKLHDYLWREKMKIND